MEKIKITGTDLYVSRICFGGCPMGGYGWGEVSKQAFIDAVNTALDLGVNFFDTADIYGIGESERVLGEALGSRRKEAIIASKFGVRIIDGKTIYDNSPEWIEEGLNESLKRLNTDYIDLYQMHYYDGKTPIKDIVEKLDELKKQGKIRYYGLSNIKEADLPLFLPYKNKFVSFQDEFSLAQRKNEQDIFEVMKKMEMTPMTWGSLGQGILSGKYDENTVFAKNDRRSRPIYVNFHGEKLKKNLKIVAKMKEISNDIGKSLPAIAVRWILDYIPNSIVLVGIKNSGQIISNCEAVDWNLSKNQIDELNEISKGE